MKAFVLMTCLIVSRYHDTCVFSLLKSVSGASHVQNIWLETLIRRNRKGAISENSSFVLLFAFSMIDFSLLYFIYVDICWIWIFLGKTVGLYCIFFFGIVQLYSKVFTNGREDLKFFGVNIWSTLLWVGNGFRHVVSFGNDVVLFCKGHVICSKIMFIIQNLPTVKEIYIVTL
jgi:hypothetical protein